MLWLQKHISEMELLKGRDPDLHDWQPPKFESDSDDEDETDDELGEDVSLNRFHTDQNKTFKQLVEDFSNCFIFNHRYMETQSLANDSVATGKELEASGDSCTFIIKR